MTKSSASRCGPTTRPRTDTPTNAVARALYRSLGFRETGERTDDGELVARRPAGWARAPHAAPGASPLARAYIQGVRSGNRRARSPLVPARHWPYKLIRGHPHPTDHRRRRRRPPALPGRARRRDRRAPRPRARGRVRRRARRRRADPRPAPRRRAARHAHARPRRDGRAQGARTRRRVHAGRVPLRLRGGRGRPRRADGRGRRLPVQGDRPHGDLRRHRRRARRRARGLADPARGAGRVHAQALDHPPAEAGRARARGDAPHRRGAERAAERRGTRDQRHDRQDAPAPRLPQARGRRPRRDGRQGAAPRAADVTPRLRLDGPNGPARVGALARLAMLPVLLLFEALELPQSPRDLGFGEPLIAVFAVYGVLSALYVFRARRDVGLAPFAVADTILLSLLVCAEGGALADVRYMLFVPVLVAVLTGPRLTLVVAVLSVGGFVAASAAHPDFGAAVTWRLLGAHALDVGSRAALAVVVSVLLTRRAERIRELAESRRSLVAQALSAEARARRELSYALHDELVQDLLCAQQDLKEARRGRPEYIDRAERALGDAVRRLRDEIFRLHPHVLESAGLAAALEAVAARQGLAGGGRASVAVAPQAAGLHDELLFSVVRDVLTNAA